jgi:hypothetical protein
LIVLRGLDPRIHVRASASLMTWMAGSSPAMTTRSEAAAHPSTGSSFDRLRMSNLAGGRKKKLMLSLSKHAHR